MWALSLFLIMNVHVQTCDAQQLVMTSDDKTIETDFFNVLFYDEASRLKACEYLENGVFIELEEEATVENAYYIYVDDQLLQKKVIENGWARVNVEYEGYLHNLKEEEVIVVAPYHPVIRTNRSFWVLSFLFILLCTFIGILLKL